MTTISKEPLKALGNASQFGAIVFKGLLIAWLLASLLFAHGCHGNEDHELFGTIAESQSRVER